MSHALFASIDRSRSQGFGALQEEMAHSVTPMRLWRSSVGISFPRAVSTKTQVGFELICDVKSRDSRVYVLSQIMVSPKHASVAAESHQRQVDND